MKDFFKSSFVAGMLVILPVGFTYLILSFIINKLDRLMAPLVREFILWSGVPLPEDFHLPGLGFFITCLFMILIGILATNFFGKKLVQLSDEVLNRIPLVAGIYSTIKKVIQSISEVEEETFEKMAVVRYPHDKTWVAGLVACNAKGEVLHRTGDGKVNVFVPMLPNVTLGWLLVVPRDQITILEMSREQGIKMLLSFGIVEDPEPATEGGQG